MAQTPCDIARDRYSKFLLWRNLWSVLLFFFGTTVVLFLCASIVLFVRSTWLPAALTTLGIMVNGTGISWISKQRETAVAEEKQAFDDVVRQCGGPAAENVAAVTNWVNQQDWLDPLQKHARRLVLRSILSTQAARELLNMLRQPF